jgi:L-alanine-DL-glutamate epimerase-like enolase superfamily enzyme
MLCGMKIREVEVVPYALPFREPYVTVAGTLTRREMVLLRLRDEDGFVGLGEAVPLSLRGGTGLPDVVAELAALSGRENLDEASLSGDALALSAPGQASRGGPRRRGRAPSPGPLQRDADRR